MTDFTGTWKNQNSSVLELTQSGDSISGRFDSGVGDDGNTIWVEVSGRTLGDVVTFNAIYSSYKTVISWVGQLTIESGTEIIKTQWLHVSDIPDDQEQDWMWFTNRIGADVFSKI